MFYKAYFRNFSKSRFNRKVFDVIVFILYLISNIKNIYTRIWKFVYIIENLTLIKVYLRRLFLKKSIRDTIMKPTESIGYNIAGRLNTYLSLITRIGVPFPVKIRKTIWQNDIDNKDGIIFITVHLPLIKVAIASLLTDGQVIDAALAAEPTLDGKMSFWGITKKVPVIQTGAMSLLKVKSILEHKGSVVLMADKDPESIIYPNIFHLAAKTNARVLFLLAFLNEDSVIEISLYQPPYCQSSSIQQTEENIKALREAREEILLKYANQYTRR